MRIGKIIKWLFILLLVVVVAGVAFLFTVDPNDYKQTIQDQARNALGRDLAIDGDIGWALSLSPSVSVEGVRLANAEGASPPDMISVGRVEAQMEILPLLSREIVVNKVVLADADIHLQADDQGGGNWVFGETEAAEPQEGGEPIIPFLGDVLVQNVNVTYVDPAGQTYQVALDEATVRSASLDSPVDLAAAGTVQGEALTVSGTVGSIQHLLDKRPDWPFELSAEIAGATAGLKGAIADTENFAALGADVTAQVPDAVRLAAMAGVADVPALPPVTVATRADLDGEIVALSDLSGNIGEATLDGNLTAKLGGAVPAVQGVLNVGALDLDALLPPTEGGETAAAPSDGRVIPDVPLPLDGLTAADADISITAESITASGMTISDLATDITLSGGVLDVALKQAGLFGGALSGGVNADAGAQSLGLDVDYQSFDLGALLDSQGMGSMITGTGNSSVSFSGAAADLRSLLAAGVGNLALDIIGGTLDTSQLNPVSRTLLKLLLPNVSSDGVIALNCAVVGYDIADGLARSNGILLDTPLFSGVAEGALDLTAETLDMLVRAQTGDVAGLSLSAPVRVAGPWLSATPTLDAGAVVGGLTQGLLPGVEPSGLRVPIVEPPAGGANQCAEALANPTYAEVGVPGVDAIGDAVDKLTDSVDNPADALGDALQEVLPGAESGGDGGGEGGLGGILKEVVPDAGGLRNLLGN